MMAAIKIPHKEPSSKKMSRIPVPVQKNNHDRSVNNNTHFHSQQDSMSPRQPLSNWNHQTQCGDLDPPIKIPEISLVTDTTDNPKTGFASRVDMLLNNELFKKHLFKHADLLKQHTLSSQRFGLQKSVSNIDISRMDFEESCSTPHNLNGLCVESKSEMNYSFDNDGFTVTDSQPVKNSKTPTHERRKSISGDLPSIEKLQFNMNTTFQSVSSGSVLAKRRLYIPTFSEFKKTRQLQSHEKYDLLKDNMCYHSLDTITEDDQMKLNSIPSLTPKQFPKSKIITVQPVELKDFSHSFIKSDPASADNTSPCANTKTMNGWMGDNSYSAYLPDTVNFDEVFMEDNKNFVKSGNIEDSAEERVSPVFRSTSDVCSRTTETQRKRRPRKQRQCKSDPFISLQRPELNHTEQTSAHFTSAADFDDQGSLLGHSIASTSGNVSQTTSFLSLEEFDISESDVDPNCEDDRHQKRLSNLSLTSNDSGVIHIYQDYLNCDNSTHKSQLSADVSSLNSCTHLSPESPSPCLLTSSIDCEISALCNECMCINSMEYEFNSIVSNLEPHSHITNDNSCSQCLLLKMEQREIIQEILETEINYGRDLNILKEEFYNPMKLAGLLNTEQLEQVFGNLDDLIQANKHFCKTLQTAIHSTSCHSDILSNVKIGSLFLESMPIFLEFENYCVHQHQAISVLEQIAKEKELLRIFLQVSQNENSVLRRMHLKSFLMVPVQRIVRYPLLLNRLYKATPSSNCDKEKIKLAQTKIEEILSHINSKTNYTTLRPKRKRPLENRRYSVNSMEKNEIQRIASDIVGWNKKDVLDLVCSKLWYGLPTDHTWAVKKCKNVKFIQIHAVLLVLGKSNQSIHTERRGSNQSIHTERRGSNQDKRGAEGILFPNQATSIEQAAVVLVREKNGKYQSVRDPLLLDKCVVTVDPEYDEVFEIQEWGKEAYLLKCDDPRDTKLWIKLLKQQTKDLSQWRKRRNALPNIMLKQIA